MLSVWRLSKRPAMAIDMLGKARNEQADIVAQIRNILAVGGAKRMGLPLILIPYRLNRLPKVHHHQSLYRKSALCSRLVQLNRENGLKINKIVIGC